ncbi:hypothetical protein FHW58_001056 [Duganella sp. 1224]|nr:hypothetical protein [Duganella sp. 1224]
MGVIIELHDAGFWKTETWKDSGAPTVRRAPAASAKAW